MVNFTHLTKKASTLVAALLISLSCVVAQTTVTVGGTGGATYATVSAAFTAINAGSVTGNIVLNVISNTTEPTTPVQLNASGVGSASYTNITIKPNAAGIVRWD